MSQNGRRNVWFGFRFALWEGVRSTYSTPSHSAPVLDPKQTALCLSGPVRAGIKRGKQLFMAVASTHTRITQSFFTPAFYCPQLFFFVFLWNHCGVIRYSLKPFHRWKYYKLAQADEWTYNQMSQSDILTVLSGFKVFGFIFDHSMYGNYLFFPASLCHFNIILIPNWLWECLYPHGQIPSDLHAHEKKVITVRSPSPYQSTCSWTVPGTLVLRSETEHECYFRDYSIVISV